MSFPNPKPNETPEQYVAMEIDESIIIEGSSEKSTQYVDWIEEKWSIRVNESTITRILQTSEKCLNSETISPNTKRHKSVTYPEVELALKDWMLRYVEAGGRAEDLRMDVLQAIRYIIQAWDKVKAEIICNCWCHTKILPDTNVDLRNISEDIRQCEDLVLNDLTNALQDDQIIEELIYLYK
ncbi:hypothetical protein C1646_773541 [Rhizophagus diaphanus]|nr:hypothetical protein C1646_773541 [Rhizophagus diaphanus] [Rhizophagus sp. MUCL 43196]